MVVVLLCSGLPLAWIVWQIIANPAAMSEAWPDAFRMKLLARTLLYNGAAAVIAAGIGLPVGIVLGRGRGIVAKALWVALPVSLLLPSLTYAYGWSQFFRLLAEWAKVHEFARIAQLLRMEPAATKDVARCIWSLATWLWPIAAAGVGISLRRMDSQVQQQALLDGALWRITLRQLMAPLVAASAVCAVLAVQEFAVYEPTGISVVATEVRMVFETGAFSSLENPITAPMSAGGPGADAPGLADQRARAAAAVATSIPLLVVIALLAGVVIWITRAIASGDEIETGTWPRALDAGAGVTIAAIAVVIICVIVPAVSLVVSLRVHRGIGEIFNEFRPQIVGSLQISLLAAAVAMGLAMWMAVRSSTFSLAGALVTFLIGGQLIAIAQIRIYNRSGLSWVYNAPPIVVMAFVARFGWIALLAGRATWSPRWRMLRDLAAVDGAGAVQSAARVIWPLAWPLLLAAGVLIMALGLTEVPATILLLPQRPPMLTPMLMTWVHMLRFDPMIESSLLLMGVVSVLGLIVAMLTYLFRRRREWSKPAAAAVAIVTFFVGCENSQPKAIWCETGTGPAQVVYPRAIAYKPQDDTFFVVDRMARVQQLDRAGQCLNEWRMPQWQTGKPVGISVGPDGNVYVPDTHYQRVMVYTPDGQLVRQWGKAGRGEGEFIFPTDIAFDSKGNVFVAEYGDNDRIQVFTPTGEFLYQFGKFGKEAGEFMRPQAIVIHDDLVYVADSCNHRLQVFKTDGTFVRMMGGVGSELGQFRYPYGLALDNDGRLVVCEFGNNRVQLIDKETGRGIKTWGSGGHEPGQLAYPWGVAVDRDDRVVAVDAGNNRLQVFEF